MHHSLHLFLSGAAPSGNGIFNLVGRVLQHLTPRKRCLGERKATCLTNAHRGAHVVLKKHLLDRNNIGVKLGNQSSELGT